jgi:2-C-methyl-D-erythritol 4-phosphate cytidylyltransferase / 2-C-methyl-D-erythritol 2,4-cyclodiphosphate synthase
LKAPSADVIVVAAGSSSRMRGVDKLTAALGGKTVIQWTLEALVRSGVVERIIIVTTQTRVDEWRAAPWLPDRVAGIVAGGARRQESVAAGLTPLTDTGTADDRVVLVHDGARPAVGPHLVYRVAQAAARHGAAVPVLPVAETLKRIRRGVVVETVDRQGLATAQTPQGARLGLLREAFARFPPDGPAEFTDEAALLEACRIPVHVVPGQPDNLKVTLPEDLDRVASVLAADRPRVGLGDDFHPFGPGQPLWLGGVEFAGAPRLLGHSDGDVVLHAVADAVLGAAGLGDLGRLFPADARTRRGVVSSRLLDEVVSTVTKAGLRPTHLDITIFAARPRLAPRLDEIRSRIAELLWVSPDQVSVKASTGNLDGTEGAGRGISARAVATVERSR